MLVTYHVKPGAEAEFQRVLSDVWDFYRKERLVLAQPHLIARADDGPGNTRFIEIFTWVSHAAPEHVPASVGKLWDQMQSLTVRGSTEEETMRAVKTNGRNFCLDRNL